MFASPLVFAAALACQVPAALSPAPAERVPPNEVQRGVTTAYYLLALAWSPEWRRTEGEGSTSQRLERDGQARGFMLHGLWPNGAAPPYPRYCNPVGTIDAATVRAMYCRTPSPELMQHEWQAHGGCGWTDPRVYFGQAARLYDRIVFPKIEAIEPLTAGAVRRAFVGRNPWLTAQGIFVQVDRGQRLTEVRLCYDLAYRPTRCPGGVGTPDRIPIRLTHSATRGF